MTDSTGADGVHQPPPETAELQRLRAQVAELEDKLASSALHAGAEPTPRRRARWRSVTAAALITLGCLLAPLAVVAVWLSDQVTDTDRYVETVAPLADDPAVQAAVTDEVTELVFTYVDIEAVTQQALEALNDRGVSTQVTDQLEALSTPLAGALEGFVRTQVAKVVESPQFAAAWERANAGAHEQMVNLLEGDQTGALSTANGEVTVNLGPVVAEVKGELVDQGFTVASNIPAVNASFAILQSDEIGTVQGAYRVLEGLGRWLPAIALTLIALGVYVARSHRRALVGAGIGVAASMLLLGTLLAVARPLYLDAVPAGTVPPDAAAAVFDTLVRFLRQALRAVMVGFLIVAVAAFLTGGSVTAVRTRAALVGGIGRMRGGAESAGLDTGRFGAAVYVRKRLLRIGAVIAGAVALTFWERPTVAVVITVTAVVLVAVAVIEFLGRPPTVARDGVVLPPRQASSGDSPDALEATEPAGSGGSPEERTDPAATPVHH